MELHEMTVRQLSEALEAGQVSSVEVTSAFLKRIADVDSQVGAFIKVTEEEALRQAESADAMRRRGEGTPLTGIPVALKDNVCVDGVETTSASNILRDFIPPYDATVVARLKAAGMPILGKTNLDEFAMGTSTETSAFGVTKNPWDLERVPGGSSGGSAAALAAAMSPLALGSDTGGSIRQPAAFCGVVGVKPTYGRVSRFGVVANASSLDHVGPMARNVADAAALLQVMAGHDPLDTTSLAEPVPNYQSALQKGVDGLRIGLPSTFLGPAIDDDVKAAIEAAVKELEAAGAEIVAVDMPHAEYALPVYTIIASAEASSNLARYDGVRFGHRSSDAPDVGTMFRNTRSEGFGLEVKRRILLGTYVLSAGNHDAYYMQALKVRTLIARDFEEAFKVCDIIATPTAPSVAFRLNEKLDDPRQLHAQDLCAVPASLAGVPALSMPCGLNSEGLPIGIQLMAQRLDEARLLQTAYALEQRLGPLPAQPQLEVESNG